MIIASFSVLLGFLLLTGVGGWLALILIPHCKNRIVLALSISPSVGLFMIGLVSFPLVKFIGPISVWAKGITIIFVLISLLTFILSYKRRVQDFFGSLTLKKMFPTFFAILVCWFLLILPMVEGGIQFSIFGKNPSDAFTYMTLAETSRSAEWKTIMEGANLGNTEGISRLASQSPTALYSARFIPRNIRLASMHSLAWFSEVTHLPVYKSYYAFSILSFLLAIPLILVLGQIMSLPTIFRYGLLAPLVIGFWPQMLIDHDCLSQIQYISILLMFVISLYLISSQQSLAFKPLCLAAICLAANVIFYAEFLAFILTCLLFYIIMEWLLGKRSFLLLSGEFIFLIILSIAILLIMDQWGYYSHSLLNQIKIGTQKNLGGPALLEPYLHINPIVTFWGLIDYFNRSVLLNAVTIILSVCLFILLGLSAAAALRKGPVTIERVLFAFMSGAVVSFVFVTLTTKEVYLMGKTLFFVLTPFAAILLMTSARAIGEYRFLPGRRIVSGVATGMLLLWIGAQVGEGVLRIGGGSYSVNYRLSENRAIYNIEPITSYLSQNIPKRLHVDVPSTKEWPFSLYCMLAFSEHKPFFRSGLVYDNRDDKVYHGLQKDKIPADYVIIKKGVATDRLKEKVAESAALELYKAGKL